MCGIAGMLRFDGSPTDPERIERALAILRPRGPDGSGVVTRGGCTLLHARLSVIDHAGGTQPMAIADADGTLSVVFNGMIYNHCALRRELEVLGHRFRSDHSDTEVLLHGYRQWRGELPRRLDGMFAFAVWDDAARTLFLCRDRMGKKPLYVRHGDGGVCFASLIEALTTLDGEGAGVDEAALQAFLRFGYTFERSLVAGVREVEPGCWMTVTGDGATRTERYWRPGAVLLNGQVRTQELERALKDAVSKRLEADVPLGCFLSGGIDSSLVAALAQDVLRQRGGDSLRTFSVRIPHGDYDESPFARQVAGHIGSDHHELAADPGADVFADLSMLVRVLGEPTADSSILPTYWLSKAARQQVTVALSGDGGDEVFAGYDRYRAMRLLARHAGWLRRMPTAPPAPGRPHALRTRLHRLRQAARHTTPAGQYAHIMHLFSTEQLRDLGLDTAGAEPFAAPDWPDDADSVTAAMAWDREHYLPFDLLRKLDRASMAVALEVRCPLLDTAVVELASQLPPQVLMPGGRPKGLLRGLARQLLPATIARRPKRGFAIPIGQWFRHELQVPLRDQLLDGSLQRFGFERRGVETMLGDHAAGRADHAHRLFALLTLQLWAQWIAEIHD